MEKKFDIIIVGGGMVGLPLAIALAEAGVNVAVLDRDELKHHATSEFDGRVSAVALSSRRMMEALGAWEGMKSHAEPILDIRVVDGHGSSFLHYTHDEVGVDRFGYIVENRIIRQALQQRAQACETLNLIAPAQIEALEQTAYTARLRLKDCQEFTAPLLVGADGKHSQIRAWANIPVLERSYDQTAIIATIAHAEPHRGVALERFFAQGPFAVLPMQNQQSSLVWVEQTAMAKYYLDMENDAFLAEVEKRIGQHLGSLTLVGKRYAHPLGLLHANRYMEGRVALIGDAAHAIHPVAGQGVNLGWRDAAVLAEVILDVKRAGGDIGGMQTLERYQRWRRFDNVAMLGVTDGLNRLFSNRSRLLKTARGIGFGMVEHVPPVKKFFMRHAMGLVGDLPRLLQGKAL